MVHGVAPLLISAAAGYWVLVQASKEKGQMKGIGQWLGVILIVISLTGAACKVYYLISGGMSAFCPPGKACPFMGSGKGSQR